MAPAAGRKKTARGKRAGEAKPTSRRLSDLEAEEEAAAKEARAALIITKAAKLKAQSSIVSREMAKMELEVKVNERIEAGKAMEHDIREAKELGLAPMKAVRLRRKSKDLEADAMGLLSLQLEQLFKESPLNGDGLLPTCALKAVLDLAPGNLKTSDEVLKPIIRELSIAYNGYFDDKSTSITFEQFKSIDWSTAVQSRGT